jgi:hypothetical protein
VGGRQLACGFETRLGYSCLSLINVVCCQVEVSATGRSLIQRSSTQFMSLSVIRCKNDPLHLQWIGRKRLRLRKKSESSQAARSDQSNQNRHVLLIKNRIFKNSLRNRLNQNSPPQFSDIY